MNSIVLFFISFFVSNLEVFHSNRIHSKILSASGGWWSQDGSVYYPDEHEETQPKYRRRSNESFNNHNTEDILNELTDYANNGPITNGRHITIHNKVTYYHGSRFYSKISSEDKITCYFKPKYPYFARYEDKTKVESIIFECNHSQYCSELECFSNIAWWIIIIVAAGGVLILGLIIFSPECGIRLTE